MLKKISIAVMFILLLFAMAAMADIEADCPNMTCPKCGATEAPVFSTRGYNCISGGKVEYYCFSCYNFFSVQKPARGAHDFGAWEDDHVQVNAVTNGPTCGDTVKLRRICSYCHFEEHKTETLHHEEKPGSRKQTKAPTCTRPGVEEWTCRRCGKVFREDIQPLGHVRKNGTYEVLEEPTCGTSGKAHYICERCGEDIPVTVRATGQHTFGDWQPLSEPTCTEQGVEMRVCQVCKTPEQRNIKALGHTMSKGRILIKEPTDWSSGFKAVACTRCGYYSDSGEAVYPPHTSFRNYSGNEKDTVKELQQMLNSLGYNCGKADGSFGGNTEKAVKQYEADCGKPQDCIAWPGLLQYLREDTAKRVVTRSTFSGVTVDSHFYRAGDTLNIGSITVWNDGEGMLDKAAVMLITSYRKDPSKSKDGDYNQESTKLYVHEGQIAPGESFTFTDLSYTVTKEDVENGYVTVSYVIFGTYFRHNGTSESVFDESNLYHKLCTLDTHPDNEKPIITVTQITPKKDRYDQWSRLDFKIIVMNPGNTELRNVAVDVYAENFEKIDIFNNHHNHCTIEPGEAAEYTFTWEIVSMPPAPAYPRNSFRLDYFWRLRYDVSYHCDITRKNGELGSEKGEKNGVIVDEFLLNSKPRYNDDVQVTVKQLTPVQEVYSQYSEVEYEMTVTNSAASNITVNDVTLYASAVDNKDVNILYRAGGKDIPTLAPGESRTYRFSIELDKTDYKSDRRRIEFYAEYTYTGDYPQLGGNKDEPDKQSVTSYKSVTVNGRTKSVFLTYTIAKQSLDSDLVSLTVRQTSPVKDIYDRWETVTFDVTLTNNSGRDYAADAMLSVHQVTGAEITVFESPDTLQLGPGESKTFPVKWNIVNISHRHDYLELAFMGSYTDERTGQWVDTEEEVRRFKVNRDAKEVYYTIDVQQTSHVNERYDQYSTLSFDVTVTNLASSRAAMENVSLHAFTMDGEKVEVYKGWETAEKYTLAPGESHVFSFDWRIGWIHPKHDYTDLYIEAKYERNGGNWRTESVQTRYYVRKYDAMTDNVSLVVKQTTPEKAEYEMWTSVEYDVALFNGSNEYIEKAVLYFDIDTNGELSLNKLSALSADPGKTSVAEHVVWTIDDLPGTSGAASVIFWGTYVDKNGTTHEIPKTIYDYKIAPSKGENNRVTLEVHEASRARKEYDLYSFVDYDVTLINKEKNTFTIHDADIALYTRCWSGSQYVIARRGIVSDKPCEDITLAPGERYTVRMRFEAAYPDNMDPGSFGKSMQLHFSCEYRDGDGRPGKTDTVVRELKLNTMYNSRTLQDVRLEVEQITPVQERYDQFSVLQYAVRIVNDSDRTLRNVRCKTEVSGNQVKYRNGPDLAPGGVWEFTHTWQIDTYADLSDYISTIRFDGLYSFKGTEDGHTEYEVFIYDLDPDIRVYCLADEPENRPYEAGDIIEIGLSASALRGRYITFANFGFFYKTPADNSFRLFTFADGELNSASFETVETQLLHYEVTEEDVERGWADIEIYACAWAESKGTEFYRRSPSKYVRILTEKKSATGRSMRDIGRGGAGEEDADPGDMPACESMWYINETVYVYALPTHDSGIIGQAGPGGMEVCGVEEGNWLLVWTNDGDVGYVDSGEVQGSPVFAEDAQPVSLIEQTLLAYHGYLPAGSVSGTDSEEARIAAEAFRANSGLSADAKLLPALAGSFSQSMAEHYDLLEKGYCFFNGVKVRTEGTVPEYEPDGDRTHSVHSLANALVFTVPDGSETTVNITAVTFDLKGEACRFGDGIECSLCNYGEAEPVTAVYLTVEELVPGGRLPSVVSVTVEPAEAIAENAVLPIDCWYVYNDIAVEWDYYNGSSYMSDGVYALQIMLESDTLPLREGYALVNDPRITINGQSVDGMFVEYVLKCGSFYNVNVHVNDDEDTVFTLYTDANGDLRRFWDDLDYVKKGMKLMGFESENNAEKGYYSEDWLHFDRDSEIYGVWADDPEQATVRFKVNGTLLEGERYIDAVKNGGTLRSLPVYFADNTYVYEWYLNGTRVYPRTTRFDRDTVLNGKALTVTPVTLPNGGTLYKAGANGATDTYVRDLEPGTVLSVYGMTEGTYMVVGPEDMPGYRAVGEGAQSQAKPPYTITLNLLGVIDKTSTLTTDDKGVLKKLPTIADTNGLHFEGWRDVNGEPVSAGHVFTSDAALYADWSGAVSQESGTSIPVYASRTTNESAIVGTIDTDRYQFTILEVVEECWYRIEADNGLTGWICGGTSDGIAYEGTYRADEAWYYKEPGLGSAAVGRIPAGTHLQVITSVINEGCQWFRVCVNGGSGWIPAAECTREGDARYTVYINVYFEGELTARHFDYTLMNGRLPAHVFMLQNAMLSNYQVEGAQIPDRKQIEPDFVWVNDDGDVVDENYVFTSDGSIHAYLKAREGYTQVRFLLGGSVLNSDIYWESDKLTTDNVISFSGDRMIAYYKTPELSGKSTFDGGIYPERGLKSQDVYGKVIGRAFEIELTTGGNVYAEMDENSQLLDTYTPRKTVTAYGRASCSGSTTKQQWYTIDRNGKPAYLLAYVARQEDVRVYIDYNGGSEGPEYIVPGSWWLNERELPHTERPGYVLDGWYLREGAKETRIDFQYACEIYQTTFIVAHWMLDPKYQVMVYFDGNGVFDDMEPMELTIGSTDYKLPVPEREGFVFTGWTRMKFWSNNENSRANFDCQKFTPGEPIRGNMILQACYRAEKTFTVTFDGNGGLIRSNYIWCDDAPTLETQASAGLPYDVPMPTAIHAPSEQDNYVYFDGWVTDDGKPFTKDTVITRDMTVYANWYVNPWIRFE